MAFRDLDIIMLALPRWDGKYSSTAFSLAKEFAKNNRVFYIDNPFTVKDYLFLRNEAYIKKRRKALLFGKNRYTAIQDDLKNLHGVTPKLTLPMNFLPSGKVYEWFSRFNDRTIFDCMKQLIEDYEIKNFIFINSFNPFYARSFPDFFKPDLYIYHTVDNIHHSEYVNRHGPRLEDEALRSADITLTTSYELQRANKDAANHIYCLPNAADISLFGNIDNINKRPGDLEKIDKPIIIYTGNIDSRIDFEIIKTICEKHDDKILFMLGPISIGKSEVAELEKYPNIIFAGRRDLEELPAYLKFADCAIIPFQCNSLTKSIYPLKINEYLAAGKPVISTPFSEDIKQFEDVIFIANNKREFANCVNDAIEDTSEERLQKRKKTVENNTWEARVKQFWQIVDDYAGRKQNADA